MKSLSDKLNEESFILPVNTYKSDISYTRDNLRASLLILLSFFIYAFITLLQKEVFISNPRVTVLHQAYYKSMAQTIVVSIYLKFGSVSLKSSNDFIKSNIFICLARFLSGMAMNVFLLFSISQASGVIIGVLNSIIPISTTILSSFLVPGESYSKKDIYSLLVCFLGALLIISSEIQAEENNSNFGVTVLGLFYCVLFVAFSSVRNSYSKLVKVDISYQILIVSFLLVIVCLVLSPELSLDYQSVILLAGIGIIEIIPSYIIIYAFLIGDIVVIMKYTYSYLPFMAILSWIFLLEQMSLYKILGIFVSLGGNLFFQ